MHSFGIQITLQSKSLNIMYNTNLNCGVLSGIMTPSRLLNILIAIVRQIERNLTLFSLYLYDGGHFLPCNSCMTSTIIFLRRRSLCKPDVTGIAVRGESSVSYKFIYLEHCTYPHSFTPLVRHCIARCTMSTTSASSTT